MKGLKTLFLSDSPDWRTPAVLYDLLNEEFDFNDDPCPIFSAKNAADGLLRPWGERVYVNPPYGRVVLRWMEKAIAELRHGTEVVVFLLPARTDTAWFHDWVLKYADEVRFVRGRIHFSDKGPAPFPSVIVVFRRGRLDQDQDPFEELGPVEEAEQAGRRGK